METIRESLCNSLWESIKTQPDALMIALSTPPFYDVRGTVLAESLTAISKETVTTLDSNVWKYDGIYGPEYPYEKWVALSLTEASIPEESLLAKAGVALCLLNDGRLTIEFTAVYKNDLTCSRNESHDVLINIFRDINFDGANFIMGAGFWRFEPFGREVFDSRNAEGIVALAMSSKIYTRSTSFSIIPLDIVSELQYRCEKFIRVLRDNNFVKNI